MALDNAQFISELSLTDPPGTDPLNQGDDQIRTVKRATQQSFPNVDAPVPQTAAQMAQMAIKNEANTFTQVNTFQTTLIVQGHIRGAFGVAATPGHSFENQINSGMYASTNLLGFATEGVERLRLTASQARFGTAQLYAQSGAVGTPSYSFLNNPDMGMYRSASNVLNFATAGADRIALTASEMNVKSSQIWLPDGNDAAPGYAFSANPATGMQRGSGDAVNLVSGGIRVTGFLPGQMAFRQATAAATLNFQNNAGVTAWSLSYEGAAGFNPLQLTFSRYSATTGTFIDNPLELVTNGTIKIHKENAIQRPVDTQARTGWRYLNAAGLPMWAIYLGADPNNFLSIQRYNSAGVFQDVQMRFRQSNGAIRMVLPTSNAGLTSGELWNNNGFVAIV